MICRFSVLFASRGFSALFFLALFVIAPAAFLQKASAAAWTLPEDKALPPALARIVETEREAELAEEKALLMMRRSVTAADATHAFFITAFYSALFASGFSAAGDSSFVFSLLERTAFGAFLLGAAAAPLSLCYSAFAARSADQNQSKALRLRDKALKLRRERNNEPSEF